MAVPASRFRRLVLAACCCGPLPAIAAALSGTVDLQDTDQLEAIARALAAHHLPALTEHQRLEVQAIHRGPSLARCQAPVQSNIAPGVQIGGRVMIELRCEVGAQWHIFVPVRVVGTTPVVVTTHAIVAGTQLARSDLALEQHDMTGLPPGYLNSIDIALGLTASRAISGGATLTNQELLGARAVLRGQTVTLVAGNGDISVRMAGRALNDGFVNQRVRALNLSSGRIVEGIARSEQVVEIVFQ